MTAERLRETLDPAHFVKVRERLGGPAPSETARALAEERERDRQHEGWYAAKAGALASYAERLAATISR